MDDLIAGIQQGGSPMDAEELGLLQGAAATALSKLTDAERQALMEELEAAQEEAVAERESVLNALANTLVAKRKQYMNGRQALGIELEWQEDEDSYEGIDDANRDEEARYRPRKPTEGGGSTIRTDAQTIRSTVFLNITAPYVDAAAAKVADMLMPTDDRSWQLKPTPVPELPGMAGTPQVQAQMTAAGPTDASAMPAMAVPAPGQPPQLPAPRQAGGEQPAPQQPPVPKSPMAEWLEQQKAEANRKAENAQRLIDDWLVECNYHREVRRVIEDAARLGTGVLKGPFPIHRKRKRWATQGAQPVLEEYEEYTPGSKAISPWDFFSDPACGENIHNGSGCFERDRLSERTLADLRGKQGYFDDQIKACLKEGPAQHIAEGRIDIPRDAAIDKQQFETWYWHGVLEREDLEVLGVDLEGVGDTAVYIPIMAQMVNDRVIKVALNPLSNGKFPYDLLPWSKRQGICWGKGVARKIRTPQRMVNALTRNLMDNTALAASIILLLRQAGLNPADGKWTLGGGMKVFLVDDEATKTARAEDAIKSVEIPSRQAEIMAIIEFALRMGEQVTGLPLLMQGQMGRTTDRVGVAQIMNNNGNTTLRAHAKNHDDHITEPHIRRYYDWLQEYVDDSEVQGDFQIDARGSSALVDRELQNQWIAQMAPYVKDPAFGINPKKWFEEFSKSVRYDPKRIQYTDEQLAQIQSQQPPPPVQLLVAQAREEGQNQRQQAQIAADRDLKILDLIADEGLSANDLRAKVMKLVTDDRRERDLFAGQVAVKQASPQGTSVDMPG